MRNCSKNILIINLVFSFILLPTISYAENNLKPLIIGLADAGDNVITYVGVKTKFKGKAVHPDLNITKHTWDFDGDGIVDWESDKNGKATHIYQEAGTYQAVFTAYDEQGTMLPQSAVKVSVLEGEGKPEYIEKKHLHKSDH